MARCESRYRNGKISQLESMTLEVATYSDHDLVTRARGSSLLGGGGLLLLNGLGLGRLASGRHDRWYELPCCSETRKRERQDSDPEGGNQRGVLEVGEFNSKARTSVFTAIPPVFDFALSCTLFYLLFFTLLLLPGSLHLSLGP